MDLHAFSRTRKFLNFFQSSSRMTRDIQTLTTPIIIPDSTTPLRKPELTKQFHPLPFPSFYRLIRSCMIYRISHKYTLVHEYIPDTFYRCKMIFIKFHNILIGEYNAMSNTIDLLFTFHHCIPILVSLSTFLLICCENTSRKYSRHRSRAISWLFEGRYPVPRRNE